MNHDPMCDDHHDGIQRRTRRDWYIGRLHIIKRTYIDPPQYGWLWWGTSHPYRTTFDVWFKQTLWTFTIGGGW